MDEDLPSREILKQLVERLDLLERVLGMNTARLRSIEERLGIAPPQRLAHVRGQKSEVRDQRSEVETPPVASLVETADLNISEATQSKPVAPQVHEAPEQTWAQPQAQHPPGSPVSEPTEQKWVQPETRPPETPATHSWMDEASASRMNEASALRTNEASASRTDASRDPTKEAALRADRYIRAPGSIPPPLTGDTRRAVPSGPSRAAPPGPSLENAVTENGAGAVRVEKRDLESTIGGSWFNWIGIIAVALGVGFFLKFAFDNQWIGPSARVSLAALVGVALLYVGERLRRRDLASYAYVISGGGLLILYLSDYAAHSLYHLIGQTPAFLLMAAITTTAVLLSVRLDALPVAILGLVGGFLTPVLLSTGVDNEVGLFTYIALLDAGVLGVAYFKRWRSLDFLSFAGTVVMTLGWADEFFSPDKIWTTLFFLSVFFLLYALLPIFHNVLAGRPSRWFDVSLAIANAAFYFGLSYALLTETPFDHATPATQALLLSIFFTGLFYTTWRWNSDDRLLRYNYLGVAATFLTVAVSIQLELHWVTMGWAVEALVLTWVGLRLRETAARHAALAVFCAAVVHWFAWDMFQFGYGVDPSFLPLLNRRALSCAVLVAAIASAARLYRRAGVPDELDENERSTVRTFFLLTGNAVALTLLSVDLNDYFTARLSRTAPELGTLLAQIENSRQFSISVLWTLYAAIMLALGLLRRSPVLRALGLLLLLTVIGKVVVFDSSFYAASWHLPVFNQTFIAYALLVAVLAFGAWLYRRKESVSESERLAMRPALLLTAHLLALAALSLEVFGYYGRLLASAALADQTTEIFRELQEGRLFALVVVWSLYATGVFLVGAWLGSRAWRWGGLLLAAVTTPLVFAHLIYYEAPWHTPVFNRTLAAFALFIVVLWLIVRTYARSGEAFEEAPIVRPIAIVAANVLAIVALSMQAVGYYDTKIIEELKQAGASLNDFESSRNLELAKQLSLSVVWALYASGLFVAARLRRLSLLRVMGLVLLSLTTIKVFLVDLSSLERVYRIISFIMLGAILLVVSYFYQRGQQRAPAEES